MTTQLTISSELASRCPQIALGILRYTANVQASSEELNNKISLTVNDIQNNYKLEDIAKHQQIANTRKAYKILGKSPSEYRNSAEALLRRVVKRLGLYKVNNVVDTGNLFSILTGFSAGSYDLNKITGNITLNHAPEGTHYEGIGKTSVNVGFLPALYDNTSAFGNPCSDSLRTSVTENAHEILTVIYAFCPQSELTTALEEYAQLLELYCQANIQEKRIVSSD